MTDDIVGLVIRHFTGKEITADFARWLIEHQMYLDGSGIGGGLFDLFEHIRDAVRGNNASNIWIAFVDEVPIGIAALEVRDTIGMHLYVKEPYRRRGYGEQLIKQVLAIEPRPYVFRTTTSANLYNRLMSTSLQMDDVHEELSAPRVASPIQR